MKKQAFKSVWDAIEDTREAAANMRVRSELMMMVQEYVKDSGATQAEAAETLGVTRPRLNDLMRGRIQKFTVDALVNMLARVDRVVEVTVTKKRRRAA